MHKRVISGCVFALFLALTPLHADDGAASIAAGGIVMKRESRVTMAKEVLKISEDKVTVDYDFRNDTDADITTDVAFPVPDYSFEYDKTSPQLMGFDDFKLWVNGSRADFDTEIHAFAGKQDVTSVLHAMHIDIAGFGHYRDMSNGPDFPDIRKLDQSGRARLSGLKAIDGEWPKWRVQKRYYWSQTFPAHALVHIRHEYTPVLGSTNSVSYGLAKEDAGMTKELKSLCIDPELRQTLTTLVSDPHTIVPYSYVDFILTTANTWKTPIEDFTLIVERPHAKDTKQNYVSFCWNGPVTKTDADHFTAHTTNLIPKKELRIGFINVSKFKN